MYGLMKVTFSSRNM